MPSRHTTETKSRALQFYTATQMNLKEVCALLDIKTTCTLTRWLTQAGIKVRTSTKHHTQVYKNYARDLYRDGMSSYKIGRILQIKPKTIQHWVKDLVTTDFDTKKRQARELFYDGRNYETIWRQIGIGRTTAHRWCKQFERKAAEASDRAA